MNYHQIKKKNRPLTPAEQVAMTSLLSGIKMLRQQAGTRGKMTVSELPLEATPGDEPAVTTIESAEQA